LEHLVGCLVVEALPGSIIQLFDDECNFFLGDVPEVGPFGEIVSEEPVGVFIGSPLPGSIGIGKIDAQFGLCFYFLELREFLAVIEGQRVTESPGYSSEEFNTLCRHGRGLLVGELRRDEITALPLDVCRKMARPFPSFHRISLPVPERGLGGQIFTACCPNPESFTSEGNKLGKCSYFNTIMWHYSTRYDKLCKRSG